MPKFTQLLPLMRFGLFVVLALSLNGCVGGIIGGMLPPKSDTVHSALKLNGYSADQIRGASYEAAKNLGYDNSSINKQSMMYMKQQEDQIKNNSSLSDSKKAQALSSLKEDEVAMNNTLAFTKNSSVGIGVVTGSMDTKSLQLVISNNSVDVSMQDNANMHNPRKEAVRALKEFVSKLKTVLAQGGGENYKNTHEINLN